MSDPKKQPEAEERPPTDMSIDSPESRAQSSISPETYNMPVPAPPPTPILRESPLDVPMGFQELDEGPEYDYRERSRSTISSTISSPLQGLSSTSKSSSTDPSQRRPLKKLRAGAEGAVGESSAPEDLPMSDIQLSREPSVDICYMSTTSPVVDNATAATTTTSSPWSNDSDPPSPIPTLPSPQELDDMISRSRAQERAQVDEPINVETIGSESSGSGSYVEPRLPPKRLVQPAGSEASTSGPNQAPEATATDEPGDTARPSAGASAEPGDGPVAGSSGSTSAFEQYEAEGSARCRPKQHSAVGQADQAPEGGSGQPSDAVAMDSDSAAPDAASRSSTTPGEQMTTDGFVQSDSHDSLNDASNPRRLSGTNQSDDQPGRQRSRRNPPRNAPTAPAAPPNAEAASPARARAPASAAPLAPRAQPTAEELAALPRRYMIIGQPSRIVTVQQPTQVSVSHPQTSVSGRSRRAHSPEPEQAPKTKKQATSPEGADRPQQTPSRSSPSRSSPNRASPPRRSQPVRAARRTTPQPTSPPRPAAQPPTHPQLAPVATPPRPPQMPPQLPPQMPPQMPHMMGQPVTVSVMENPNTSGRRLFESREAQLLEAAEVVAERVREQVRVILNDINQCPATDATSREYNRIYNLLTHCIFQLDELQAPVQRQLRRETMNTVDRCTLLLERKVHLNLTMEDFFARRYD